MVTCRTNTISVVLYTLILLTSWPRPISNTSPVNMYDKISGPHEGGIWGRFCYDFTLYTPTCGWKAIVTMAYTITEVEVWDTTKTRLDDYTFELVPVSYFQDLSSRTGQCSNINIKGSFGNTEPALAVSYSCVCTAFTSGNCNSVPFITVPPAGDATTSAIPPSTTGIPLTAFTTIPPRTPTPASPGPLSGSLVSGSNVTSISLSQIPSNCYTGPSKLHVSSPVSHLTDCGSFCLSDVGCQGINFHSVSTQCELVRQEVQAGHTDLAAVDDCQFWRVLWKR